MADRDTITLKVAVDAKQAATGLRPLNTALEQTKKVADQTEAELEKIGGDVGKIKINDDAIDAARKEIKRLRTQMREDLAVNIDTDTSASLKRINALKRTIKSLDDESVELKVDAKVEGGESLTALGSNAGIAAGGFAKLSEKVGGAKTLWAAAGAAVVSAGWSLVQLSADAESARLQLDTLTGSTEGGAKAFEELNRFAAETPFEFDEITDAASQLLAAGIDTKDLSKNLLAIGDAASAVNAPIGEVALAYSQMVSKGKVSNEEMLQLQERGIDAYGTLAKKMGLTVGEVNKLASESKLGRKEVDLLRQGMEETYGGSMQRQARSLNGQLSTMGDNLKALGKDFGDILTPGVKGAVEQVGKLVLKLDELMDKRAEFLDQAKDEDNDAKSFFGGTIFDWLGEAKQKFTELGDVLTHFDPHYSEDKAKAAADASERQAKATAKIKDEQKKQAKQNQTIAENAEAARKAAEAHEKAVKEANDELSKMADLYADIGGNIRTKVSFIFSTADLNEEIRKLTSGKGAIELPAHLRLDDLGALGENQQKLVETISGSVEAGLQEGGRRAQLNPNFDEVAWYRQVREKTKGQLIQAGIDPKDINRVLTNVFGLPRTIPVGANMDQAQKDVNDFNAGSKTLKINPEIQQWKPKIYPGGEVTEAGTLPEIPAPIAPKVDQVAAKSTTDQLGNVAAPGGSPRVAKVAAKIDGPSLRAVDARLDKLTLDRHMTIFVHVQRVKGGGQAGTGALAGVGVGPTVAPSSQTLVAAGRALLASPASVAPTPSGYAPGSQTALLSVPGAAPAPTRMHPSQTPVQVLLDGAEIADRLDLRRSLAAVESVRRTP